eukprot:TRINITY_DN32192_c0_g1_i1.p1 TRINITY_DN32192_c0_g1~~TRINITY_DN32192_c0_g1_i1.p1  ORF type:complete len:238 (+),score=30.96 TRINITY_DN32192_c0_g1_i1:158-871(+)
MLVSSYAPTPSWACLPEDYGLVREPSAPSTPARTPREPQEPATRPLPIDEPASGSIGPGAYRYSESLTRKAVNCPRFLKADRFRAPHLEVEVHRPRPSSPEAGNAADEAAMWKSRSDPRLSCRVRLGRACWDNSVCPPTFAMKESDVEVRGAMLRDLRRTSSAADFGATSSAMGDLGSTKAGAHRPLDRRPPVMGHPLSLAPHPPRQGEGGTYQPKNIGGLRLFGAAAKPRRRILLQ